MLRRETTVGIVLKNINYRDSDKIYTLISPDFGKFSVSARGVRKISSKRLPFLDTLNKVEIGFSYSKSGHKVLTEVKLLSGYAAVKNNPEFLKRALYAGELIHRFIEEDFEHHHHERERLYKLLEGFLTNLADSDSGVSLEKAEELLSSYELSLMQLLGYSPQESYTHGLYLRNHVLSMADGRVVSSSML